MKNILYVVLALVLWSCTNAPTFEHALEAALASQDIRIRRVLDSIGAFEVQIRFTQIDRNGNRVEFTDHDFQVDEQQYFYPASTVKFPAAIAALEKLNEMDSLDRRTRFYVEGDSIVTTFTEAIEAIFAISDNAANNRLIAFLGFDDLNGRFKDKGIPSIRISHRLAAENAHNVTTLPLIICNSDSSTVTSKPLISAPPKELDLKGIKKGKGFMANDSLHSTPFDFRLKNHYPIAAQHETLKRIVFPEAYAKEERFQLAPEQREFLLDCMAALPYEKGYDRTLFPDSYGKFLLFGDSKDPIPKHIRIYNKVGYAYGTLTDCAYVHDAQNKIEFMVTATILVNRDGIFNNDVYEYETIGIPFLAQLGRELHAFESARKM